MTHDEIRNAVRTVLRWLLFIVVAVVVARTMFGAWWGRGDASRMHPTTLLTADRCLPTARWIR